MDKITKNPDGAKFTDSPRTSNAESQIEKFRQEISKKSESDFINTRKLSIQSTVKHETHEANEIDRQISDLESLIKRLQDEIVEMSNNAEKPDGMLDDDDPPLDIKEDDDDKEEINKTEESHETKTSDPIDANETNSHVYPVIVSDVGFSINDQSHKFDSMVSDLVNFPGASSSDGNTVPKTFSSIRRDIGELWSEENLNNDKAGEAKAIEDDYHLQKLIGELKTEINEKLCSMSDLTMRERTNNSEENIGNSSEQPESNPEESEPDVEPKEPDP